MTYSMFHKIRSKNLFVNCHSNRYYLIYDLEKGSACFFLHFIFDTSFFCKCMKSRCTQSSKMELVKLQTAKQSADKLCTPSRYQPPPANNVYRVRTYVERWWNESRDSAELFAAHEPLNRPFLPLVVSRGYGLSANKPIATTPQTPLAPTFITRTFYHRDKRCLKKRKKFIKVAIRHTVSRGGSDRIVNANFIQRWHHEARDETAYHPDYHRFPGFV